MNHKRNHFTIYLGKEPVMEQIQRMLALAAFTKFPSVDWPDLSL